MDPIRSLNPLAMAGATNATEGRVESRDESKGTVVVRLPGNETVVAQGSGLQPGDRVGLARSPEGVWIARPLLKPEGQPAPVLSTWMTEPPGSDLGEALRSGEPRMIRTALVALWRRMDSAVPPELPQALQEARRRGMPPLVSRSEPSARSAPTSSAVPLALRAETSPGVYRGEVPGRRFELTGPPGIRLGEAGLWTESVLSEILSVWLPATVEDVAVPGLPARVAADASGARRLLDHLGVELSAEEAESPSFRALVRSLVRAGAMFAGETPAEEFEPPSRTSSRVGTPDPPARSFPGEVPAAARGDVSPAPSVLAPVRRGEIPLLSPPVQADVPDLLAPSPSRSRSLVSRLEDPQAHARMVSGGADDSVASPIPGNLPASPETGADPLPETATPPARPSARFEVPLAPATPAVHDLPPEGKPVAEDSPSVVAVVRELPAAVALRVVLAWLAAAEEPSEALLRAAVGGFRELPEALQILARTRDQRPEDFEAVAAFLRQTSPESPLLPRDLGLDRRSLAEATPEAQPARPLSQAIVEDLAKALSQGRTEDASVLREALGSLVGEALDRARDPSNPMSSAPWTMPPSDTRPDSGRVVVRDRRKSPQEASDKTVVEVSMNPSGLGSVDARLTLRGDDLDVVFHARESSTVDRIREHLPELRSVLVQLGLQPKDLEARPGKPGAAKRSTEVRDSSGGLDIRA